MVPDCVKIHVNALFHVDANISEVWLVGSQANGAAGTDSDYDLLIFGNQATIGLLALRSDLRREDIDLLVLVNSDEFKTPWEPNKSGTLTKWQWQKSGEESATYTAAKWVDAVDGAGVRCSTKNAIRIFSKE